MPLRRAVRRPCLLVVGLLVLSGCSGAAGAGGDIPIDADASVGGGAADDGHGSSSAPACRLVERAREVLRTTDDQALYVEPSAVLAATPDAIVVGTPAYAWTDAGDERHVLTARDHILGASLVPPGRPIAHHPEVPEPTWVRATVLPDGRVGALLEHAPERRLPTAARGEADGQERAAPDRGVSDQALEIGFAVLEAGRGVGGWWGAWEPLPEPSHGRRELALGSDPVAAPTGEVFWASLVSQRPGVDVVLHRRDPADRAWSTRIVSRTWADDVGLLWARAVGGPLVTVTGLDPALGEGIASVRLIRAGIGTPEPVLLDRGDPGERFRDPAGVEIGGDLHFAWIHESVSGALALRSVALAAGRLDGGVPEPRTVASGVLYFALAADSGATFAVAERQESQDAASRLEVHRIDGQGARLVYSSPSPFTGPMGAVVDDRGDLVIVGPLAQWAGLDSTVRSLVLRLSPSCTQGIAANPQPGRTPHLTRRHDATSTHPSPTPRRPRGGGM